MEIKKSSLLLGIAGILFSVALFLIYEVSVQTGSAVVGSSGKIDTTGWTDNEKMNYEMHGTIPARIQEKISASSGTGMVGGC